MLTGHNEGTIGIGKQRVTFLNSLYKQMREQGLEWRVGDKHSLELKRIVLERNYRSRPEKNDTAHGNRIYT